MFYPSTQLFTQIIIQCLSPHWSSLIPPGLLGRQLPHLGPGGLGTNLALVPNPNHAAHAEITAHLGAPQQTRVLVSPYCALPCATNISCSHLYCKWVSAPVSVRESLPKTTLGCFQGPSSTDGCKQSFSSELADCYKKE